MRSLRLMGNFPSIPSISFIPFVSSILPYNSVRSTPYFYHTTPNLMLKLRARLSI